jgi:hypothetical protein
MYSGRDSGVHQAFVFATGDNYTSGSERMRITSTSGNVGNTKVSGRLGRLVTNNPYIRLQGNSGTGSVYADVKLDTVNQLLVFNNPGTTGGTIGTNPMVLTLPATSGSGRLVLLHTHGYTTIDGVDVVAAFSSDNTAKRVNIGYSTSGDYGFINAVHTNVAWKNLILGGTTGYVGIGTTSPSDKLTLNSSGSGTGFKITGYQPENFINLNNILSTGNRTFRLISGITSVGYDGFSIFDTVSNATRFVIDNGGNVGIGTTSPGFTLGNGLEIEKSGTATLRATSGSGLLVLGRNLVFLVI